MDTENTLNEHLGTTEVIWKLSDLYTTMDDPALQTDISWCDQEACAIREAFTSTLPDICAPDLLRLVQRLEALHTLLGKLSTFAFLNFITQVDNARAGNLYQQMQEVYSRCSREVVFFELDWNTLEREKAIPTSYTIAIISRPCAVTGHTSSLKSKKSSCSTGNRWGGTAG
jgi:oligoendopeptidase F